MPYSGSGSFTVANSFTPNTTISSSLMNATLADFAAGLSNVLTRDNQASMTGPLRLADGTLALPGLQFGSDTNTGIRRSAADEMRLVTGGVDRVIIDAAGKAFFLGDLEITGDLIAAGLGGSLPLAGGTLTGLLGLAGDSLTTAIAARINSQAAAIVYNTHPTEVEGAAVLDFHRSGRYSVLVGLDTDNKFKIGGASMGAVAHEFFHQGRLVTMAEVTDLVTTLAAKASTAALDAAVAALNLALAGKPSITSQTGTTDLAYDVGTILLAQGGLVTTASQNQVCNVYRGTTPFFSVNISGFGSQLTGTWRARGTQDSDNPTAQTLVQRVA